MTSSPTTLQAKTTSTPGPAIKDERQPAQPSSSQRGSMATDVGELFERYHHEIFRLCLGMLGDHSEAEDATQEIFLRAHRAWASFDYTRSAPRTWLGHIAMNYCRSALRRRRLGRIAVRLFRSLSSDGQMSRLDLQVDIGAVLQLLDTNHRSVVLLRYYLNFTCAEISQILKLNEGTVHSRLHTARQRMQSLLSVEDSRHE